VSFLKLFERKNLISAHRGARSIAPENTLRSMKKSVGDCDFIEIDVQLSSDCVSIIMHDETLNRTTNALEIYREKSSYKVSDFTLKELDALDYGSWFDAHKEPLLTFEIALKFIKKQNLFLNVEIKDMSKIFSDEVVVSKVINEIKSWHVEELVIISSFRHEYLPLCKKILPNIPTAALVEKKHPKDIVKYLNKLDVECYNMSDKLVDKEMVLKLKKAGFFVGVYTINDKARAKELFEMGVNAIFSDTLKKSDLL
jgi:glycerophosphoryl diester phosphodiesterase